MADSARRRRARGMTAGVSLLVLAAAGVVLYSGGASRWWAGDGARDVTVAGAPAAGRPADLRTDDQALAQSAPPTDEPQRTPAAERPQAAPPAPAPSSVPAPIVAEGRTPLPGGLMAVRTGDTVVVHFDTPETRTRRPEKFERIVRETLPAIYGALAGDALAGLPAGQLVAGAELLEELPARGMRLRTAQGGELILWPATRPGRDGPLVVSYRATVLR